MKRTPAPSPQPDRDPINDSGPSLGERVRLNELGASRHRRAARKVGRIAGGSSYPGAVSVMWDGSLAPVTIHKSYLESV